MNALTYGPNPQVAADVEEPSMTELLARLAALGEDIRRARQRYGLDARKPSNGGKFPDDSDEH